MSEFFSDAGEDRDRRRVQIQLYIDELEPRVRRRLRGKFYAIHRGPYDLDDIMASTRRRVDLAFVKGAILAGTCDQFNGFIFRIAERLAINAVRQAGRAQNIDPESISGLPAPPEVTKHEAAEEVQRVMDLLNDDERQMIRLQQQGYSQERIAAWRDVHPEAQRSRWRRLTRRLREMMRRSRGVSKMNGNDHQKAGHHPIRERP